LIRDLLRSLFELPTEPLILVPQPLKLSRGRRRTLSSASRPPPRFHRPEGTELRQQVQEGRELLPKVIVCDPSDDIAATYGLTQYPMAVISSGFQVSGYGHPRTLAELRHLWESVVHQSANTSPTPDRIKS
jgi:hypothetical protein